MLCIYNILTGEKDKDGKSICPVVNAIKLPRDVAIIGFCQHCPHRLNALTHR